MNFFNFLLGKNQANNNVYENQQLNDLEITFLRMLEGKRANDESVLSWWCAQNKINRNKTIKKLLSNNYIGLSDYKYNVNESTVTSLKDFLKKHQLPVKGKKPELIIRVLENISESDCISYFTQCYYVFTQKSQEMIREIEIKEREEDNKKIELIRQGFYNELKNKMYPNKNEHWGTEDTFFDTIDYTMKHGFEELNLPDNIRENASSFIALHAVDFFSRSHSSCKDSIIEYFKNQNIELDILKTNTSLAEYLSENEIYSYDEMYDIYIQFVKNRARAVAELNNYKRLGINKVQISVVNDNRTCSVCFSKNNKKYSINSVPLLPLCWDCRCCYSIDL